MRRGRMRGIGRGESVGKGELRRSGCVEVTEVLWECVGG